MASDELLTAIRAELESAETTGGNPDLSPAEITALLCVVCEVTDLRSQLATVTRERDELREDLARTRVDPAAVAGGRYSAEVSPAEWEHRARVAITLEQDKLATADNALIALLADGVRLIRERFTDAEDRDG